MLHSVPVQSALRMHSVPVSHSDWLLILTESLPIAYQEMILKWLSSLGPSALTTIFIQRLKGLELLSFQLGESH